MRVQDPPTKPPYRELKFRLKGTRNRPHPPTVEGWDTETHTSGEHQGRAFVLANSRGWRTISSLDQALDELHSTLTVGKRNVWWNIDYDVTAIFKHDLDVLEELTKEGQVTYEGREIFYIPRKFLKITTGARPSYHYDIYQFFRCSLEHGAAKYLERSPPDTKAKRDRIDELPILEVGEYCRWDATATKDLATYYLKRLHSVDLWPKHLISNGSLAELLILQDADIPVWSDNPRWANVAAWGALRGAWIDLWRRGTENVWKFDIKSAYPAVLYDVPDLRDGHWIDEYDQELGIGFHLCEMEYSSRAVPMIASWTGHTLVYPDFSSRVRAWLSNDEILRLRSMGCSIDVLDGTSFVPPENPSYPWRELLDKLMHLKNDAQDDPGLYLATKALINSFYGKKLQKIETDDGWLTSRIFNPVVASLILSRCRCWLLDAMRGNEHHVVGIATDCVITDKDIGLELSTELGGWELESEDKRGVFYRPGIYEIDGERTHTRGFRLERDENGEPKSFFDIFDTDASEVSCTFERPITSREAVHWQRARDANTWVQRSYTLSLGDDRRLWRESPEVFRDLLDRSYESEPIPAEVLGVFENL